MTAKTTDGKEIYRDSKIYMPQATDSRGEPVMKYGAHLKMGLIADTSLQPLQTKEEKYEIKFPYEDIEKDGKKIREIKFNEIAVTVELRYQLDPAIGEIGKRSFILYNTTKTVSVK